MEPSPQSTPPLRTGRRARTAVKNDVYSSSDLQLPRQLRGKVSPTGPSWEESSISSEGTEYRESEQDIPEGFFPPDCCGLRGPGEVKELWSRLFVPRGRRRKRLWIVFWDRYSGRRRYNPLAVSMRPGSAGLQVLYIPWCRSFSTPRLAYAGS